MYVSPAWLHVYSKQCHIVSAGYTTGDWSELTLNSLAVKRISKLKQIHCKKMMTEYICKPSIQLEHQNSLASKERCEKVQIDHKLKNHIM